MITIKTYKGQEVKGFYIQSKGVNAGKPMRTPSANCFTVVCDERVLLTDFFFYVVLNAYNQGKFITKGTAVPYITKQDIIEALR